MAVLHEGLQTNDFDFEKLNREVNRALSVSFSAHHSP